MTTQASELRRRINSRGGIMYEIELYHPELNKHRLIKGNDPHYVSRKAEVQQSDWNDQWNRKLEFLQREKMASERMLYSDRMKFEAANRTEVSKAIQECIQTTLQQTLSVNDAIDWDTLKDNTPFNKPKPVQPNPPARPQLLQIPREPLSSDDQYQPTLKLADRIIKGRRESKIEESLQQYKSDFSRWELEKNKVLEINERKEREHQAFLNKQSEKYRQELSAWEAQRAVYEKHQKEQNEAVDRQRDQYLQGNSDAIVSYCELVLDRSAYLDFFPKEFELDYNPDAKILIVEYSLPAPEEIPTLTEVKYIASKAEFTEKHLSQANASKLYDDLLYQVTLRTIHELFEADQIGAIATIVFNGHVRSTDRGTGKEVNACVLSIQVGREEFLGIHLEKIDPKTCFKQLKGVGSSKLHSVAAVAPLMQIRREDGRFISSRDVAYQLDDGYNLAAMDWEEFEHLIREVFEKEFSTSGGEVKVTQASRDGGVDAVAFDPDPIRGGKIVIQAKRYTNTVGVAAVRDLYGTVMNEGATKGILVTTSDYGPDAYDFAKGKPLSLLNGANLLHLLERHGHKAKIDLQEARKIAMEQSKQ